MENFELRPACNELIAELKDLESRKNIVKVSVDIQLPERYSGNPDELFHALRALSGYLARVLVNGLINIEISLHTIQNKTVNLLIKLSGQGVIRPMEKDKKNVNAFIKGASLKISHKEQKQQINFGFHYSLQATDGTKADQQLPFANKRVLIAEDNEINAMVFSSFLDEWGCEHELAINGAEAVSLAHDKVFDAILMDIHMPILNGNQATRKIREFSTIPIIALTASTQENDIKEAVEAGANDYLLKPISSAHLFQVLCKYLRPT